MPSSLTLDRWLSMARDDVVAIDAADILHEAQANMWSFSPHDDAPQDISTAGLVHFITQIMAARQQQLTAQPPMLFYCWHDAQARQLRFSLVSATHGRLPFGCATNPAATLAAIAERVVHGDWYNPQWGALGADDTEPDSALPVFVALLQN